MWEGVTTFNRYENSPGGIKDVRNSSIHGQVMIIEETYSYGGFGKCASCHEF